MTISGQRFQALDEEFNVAMTSISQSDPRQILNTAFNSLSQITNAIRDAVNKMKGASNPNTSINAARNAISQLEKATGLTRAVNLLGEINDTIREVKGLSKSSLNTDKYSSKNLERYASELFSSDPIAQNLLRQLSGTKRNDTISDITTAKPFVNVAINNSNNESTPLVDDEDSSQIASLVNRLSNNQYDVTTVDNNALLRQTVAAGNLAYDSGMTGVLTALSNMPNLQPDVLARATAIIMQDQANKGNTAAVLDMVSQINQDNFPIAQSPSVVQDTATNFNIPMGVVETKLPQLANQFTTALDALNPGWKNSDYDNNLSLKAFDKISEDLSKSMQTLCFNNIFTESDLTTLFDTDNDVIETAMIGFDPTVNDLLKRMSTSTSCATATCNC